MIRLRAWQRTPIARKIRRYRRPLAATLAALSVLIIVSVLKPAPPVEPTIALDTTIGAQEVGVPLTLANAALASAIRIGDVVDVIAVDESTANSRVIASAVRVVEVHQNALIVIAAAPHQSTELIASSLSSAITVAIHPRGAQSQ
jgi:hypothetical protein